MVSVDQKKGKKERIYRGKKGGFTGERREDLQGKKEDRIYMRGEREKRTRIYKEDLHRQGVS